MEDKLDLKVGETFIMKIKTSSYSAPFKCRILDVTKTTVYIKNLDGDIKFRILKEDFKNEYMVLEFIETKLDEACKNNENFEV